MTPTTRVLLLGQSIPLAWSVALQADGDISCTELSTRRATEEELLKRIEAIDLVCVWVGDCRELAVRRVEELASAATVPVIVLESATRQEPTDWCRLGAVMTLEGPPRNDVDSVTLRTQARWAAKVTPVVHARPPRRWGVERGTPAVRTLPQGDGVSVVAIASSSGGPRALGELVSKLPADFSATLLVVQHMAGEFLGQLAADLQRRCALEVCVATKGDRLGKPRVILAPDAVHMELAKTGQLRFFEDTEGHSHVPAADVLLSSVANACGGASTGVVLTGIGDDGAKGALEIHAAGGVVYAQTEDTCTVFGMPKAAVAIGAVDRLLAPKEIGKAIAARYAKRVAR
jgi:two-component system, chemotaxis family, protein-glutamate methylesterase/glutaminase